jgi:hypothetical protein
LVLGGFIKITSSVYLSARNEIWQGNNLSLCPKKADHYG